MKISHNTFTYKIPNKWYLVPFFWIARCQSKDYTKQNCDGYDIRIWFNKHNNIEFRHGNFSYNASEFYNFLTYCNTHKKILRVMLECRNNKMLEKVNKYHLNNLFIDICNNIKINYPNIKLFGGRNILTWEKIYDFGWEPVTYDYYSSQDGNEWYKQINNLCPWIWSKLHNKKVLKLEKKENICLYDFL